MTKVKIDYAALSLDDVVSPSEMTVGQIITEFRQAKDRKYTLQALADQVCCTVDDMKELLISHGVKPVEMPRARRKKEPVENFRGGVEIPPPAPEPTPAELLDRPTPEEFAEACDRAVSAMKDLMAAYALQAAALDAAQKKLDRLRAVLDWKGESHNES